MNGMGGQDGRPFRCSGLVFPVYAAASGLAGDGGFVEVLSGVGGNVALGGGVAVEGVLEMGGVRVGVGEFVAGDVVLGVGLSSVCRRSRAWLVRWLCWVCGAVRCAW